MSFHQEENVYIQSINKKTIKHVEDFKYLGSYVNNTENDMKIRISKAWAALNNMQNIWKSNLPRKIKVNFFRATVESILVYGSTTWTLTVSLRKRLNGTYTRMLRAILNISWKQHITNKELYQDIPEISDTIRRNRLRLSGHCWRNKEEVVSDLILWQPSHGRRKRGRPAKTFIDQIMNDTGISNIDELKNAMENRDDWKLRVNVCRENSMQ